MNKEEASRGVETPRKRLEQSVLDERVHVFHADHEVIERRKEHKRRGSLEKMCRIAEDVG